MPRKRHPLAPSRSNGRPLAVKATPELVEAACAEIASGLTVEAALIRQGISRQAMDKWRARNPAVELRFQRAEADFENLVVAQMRLHAVKDAKAMQWLAERRLRGSWLPPVARTELTGKDGGPIQALTLSKVLLASVAQGPDQPRPMKQAVPA